MGQLLVAHQRDLDCGDANQRIIQSVAAGVTLVGFFFIVYKIVRASRLAAQGKHDDAEVMVLPIYDKFLKTLACLLICRSAFLWFLTPDSNTFDIIDWPLLNPAVATLRDGVAVFLAQSSAGTDSVRWTGLTALLWVLAQIMLGFTYIQDVTKDSYLANHCYWTLHDLSTMCYHVVTITIKTVVHWKNPEARSRTAVYQYSSFMIIVFSAYFAMMLGAVPYADVGCYWTAVDVVYYSAWPFVLYRALRQDSIHWRNMGLRAAPQALSTDALLQGANIEPTLVIDFSRITYGTVLAQGGSAHVCKGTLDKQVVAIKKFAASSLKEADVRTYLREMTVLSYLKHPNILQLYGICVIPPWMCLVVEFMEYGSLYDVLDASRDPSGVALSNETRGLLAEDMWRAIAFLHAYEPPVLHGDIKSLNCLVNESWTLKLCDFGECRFVPSKSGKLRADQPSSRAKSVDYPSLPAAGASARYLPPPQPNAGTRLTNVLESSSQSSGTSRQYRSLDVGGAAAPPTRTSTRSRRSGYRTRVSAIAPDSESGFRRTPQWTAPEVLRGEPYSRAADVYSAGLVMWEMWSDAAPFAAILAPEVPSLVVAGARPRIPPSMPPVIAQLVTECWSHKPEARPSASAVLAALNNYYSTASTV